MKKCPKCGAPATDQDLFCEADGAPLEGASANPAAKASLPCPSCGLLDADEGDGYCAACGHRLAAAAPVARFAVGARVGDYTVTAARDADDVLAKGPDGADAVVAFGTKEELALEEKALRALAAAKDPSPFPRVLSSGAAPDGSALLALSAPTSDAHALLDVGPLCDLREGLDLARRAIDLAAVIEAHGVAWEPRASDLGLRLGGALVLSRLRGATPLAKGERMKAQRVLEAIGAALLPMPLVHADRALVRAFLAASSRNGEAKLAPDDARALLDRPLDPPAAGDVAELCDPGMRRDHNEDATATASGGEGDDAWTVLVVCDGVSSSTHAEQASTIAARTTRDALAHFARSGDIAHEGAASAMTTAIRAAHVAVCSSRIEHGDTAPPGTTLVAALVHKRRLTVGWIGDSRAYWVSPVGSELLTHDHSWVNETVARGEMTEAEALAAPLAHALTKCIGPLEVGDGKIEEVEPDIRVRKLPGPGHVVLCSDGLWNYFPGAPEVALLVRSAGDGAGAAEIAKVLVNHALAKGGGDNVSVAVCAFR